jgi:transcription elongation GreA/GreB family factor
MGKKAGEMTTIRTPGGEREMEIVKLSTIHDLEGKE